MRISLESKDLYSSSDCTDDDDEGPPPPPKKIELFHFVTKSELEASPQGVQLPSSMTGNDFDVVPDDETDGGKHSEDEFETTDSAGLSTESDTSGLDLVRLFLCYHISPQNASMHAGLEIFTYIISKICPSCMHV